MYQGQLKKLLAGILTGLVIGGAGAGLFIHQRVEVIPVSHVSSDSLSDVLISSWIQRYERAAVGLHAASKDLPDARYGYFPAGVRALADSVQEDYGVPAPIILAQWALESNFGQADLGANNYFGHKCSVGRKYGDATSCVTAWTNEYRNGRLIRVRARFARYSSIAQCFDAQGRFLTMARAFRGLKFIKRLDVYAETLGEHYATDPDYGLKLITIINRYKLEQ